MTKLAEEYKRNQARRWPGEEPLKIGSIPRSELPFTVIPEPMRSSYGQPSWYVFDEPKEPGIRIGDEAFGCVYRGTMTERRPNLDPTIHRSVRRYDFRVAVKFVRCDFTDEEEKSRMRRLFWNEMARVGFDYPSVNRFVYLDKTTYSSSGFWAIVSDLCIDPTLLDVTRKYLEAGEATQSRTRTVRGTYFDAVAIVCAGFGLACAIGYLHMLGFVHRDIKPSHVLLTEDMKPRLTGFALMVRIDDPHLQNRGNGTIPYIPPEARMSWIETSRRLLVTEKFDVYSLGVVLSFLFAGEDPEREGFSLCEAAKEFESKKLADVVAGCLNPDPRERWSIVQVIEALADPDCYKGWWEIADDLGRFEREFTAYKNALLTPAFMEGMREFRDTPITEVLN